MTLVGAGGHVFASVAHSKRFAREYAKVTAQMKDKVDAKLRDLCSDPMPAGLAFEKLKGYADPDIYTIHVTGNYKISLEVLATGGAWLRRVGTHDEITRAP